MNYFENYSFYVAKDKLFVTQYINKNREQVSAHLSLGIEDLFIQAEYHPSNLVFFIYKGTELHKIALKIGNKNIMEKLLNEISKVIANYYSELKIS